MIRYGGHQNGFPKRAAWGQGGRDRYLAAMLDAPLACRVRRAAPGQPPRLLVLIHGFGYHPEEMLAYATAIDPERRFVIVAPRGPIVLPSGAAGWALPQNREPPQFPQAAALLAETLDAACTRYGVDRHDAVVGGFSQGGILSFTLALDPAQVRPAAVLSWCGGLPIGRGTPTDFARLAGLPVCWQLAQRDEIIPLDYSRAGIGTAIDHGAVVVAHEYDTTHAVSVELLADARAWLAQRGGRA
jgi:phospholipase/carboxylesterase